MNKKAEGENGSKSSFVNVGITIVLASILYFAIFAGGTVAFSFSELPDIFWIAIVLVILFLLIRRK